MTAPLSAQALSVIGPALMLFLVVTQTAAKLRRPLPPVAASLLLVACLLLLGLPWDGLSPARRLAGFLPGLSLTFTIGLLVATLPRLGGPDWIGPGDLADFGRFGALAGLLLYPAALGLGRWDPYTSGWHFSALFVVVGVGAACLLLRGQRFGWILLSAIGAWHLGLLESTNYWDYLVDPVYFLVSLPLVVWTWRGSSERASANRRADRPSA